jgi:hypothetical protein
MTRWLARSMPVVLGREPSLPRVPAARRPATIPCSSCSGRTARLPVGLRTGPHHWVQRGTVPGRTARLEAGLARTALRRRSPARSVRVPARAGVPVAPPRTALGRSRPPPVRDPAASNLAGLAATVVPDRGHRLALALVPGRRQPSQARTGQPTAVPPRTAPGRRLVVPVLPRVQPTPVRVGILAVGLMPGPGSSVPGTPGTPGPAGSPGYPVPGDQAALPVRSQAWAVRPPGLRARLIPALAGTRTRQGRSGRRGRLRAVARAGARSAADLAQGQGHQAGGAGLPGAAEGGRHPASRPQGAARAGRPTPLRTLPASQFAADSRAWAASRRAQHEGVVARGACPRAEAARAPRRPRRPGN